MEKEMDERIDRFIENEMQPAERDAFCHEMAANPKLKEQVILRKLLVEAEWVEAEQAARKAMQKRRRVPLLPTKRVGGFIAIAALLLGVVFLIGNGHRYTSDEIYQIYYAEPVVEPSRSGNAMDVADIQTNSELVKLYRQQKYTEVAALYDQYWSNRDWSELPVASLLYATVSLLHCNRAAETIPLLSCSYLLTSPYSEEAEWLLLFAYLQIGELEEASRMADQIKAKDGQYGHQATQILLSLKEKRWF